MYVTLPYVLGVRESLGGNLLRQVVGGRETVEGTVARFTRDRIRGWLFQPDTGNDILIVRRNTRLEAVPRAYTRVLAGELADVEAQQVDLSESEWLRHERLGLPAPREAVLDSWGGALRYIQEDPEQDVIGLRRPQIGAVHAVHAHWSVSAEPATVVMPTGTGKTDAMLAVLAARGKSRGFGLAPARPNPVDCTAWRWARDRWRAKRRRCGWKRRTFRRATVIPSSSA